MGKTLELAKKQGLVKTRKINNVLKAESEKKIDQKFAYFMIIDFEATCWEKKQNAPQSEVIEFPAVILNSKTGQIHDEYFHVYVQPTEEPYLSEFCRKLTGITQEQVDNAAPLGTSLLMFNNWIKKFCPNFIFNAQSDKNCAVITWTDWDLKICLENECKRKNLNLPNCFKSWIDLKLIYKKFYNRPPQGLNGALQEMGLVFQGREHSGICDAKNTAKLVAKMIQDGCILGLTKSLPNVKIDPKLAFDDQIKLPNLSKPPPPQKTPLRKLKDITNLSSKTTPRKTPPLCSCGRRSKFLSVVKPGPNNGRKFYACPTKNCSFFKWEHSFDLGQSPALARKSFI